MSVGFDVEERGGKINYANSAEAHSTTNYILNACQLGRNEYVLCQRKRGCVFMAQML